MGFAVSDREHGHADLPVDLADASQVVLAEELGGIRILSTYQRSFRAYRWKHREPYRDLLLGLTVKAATGFADGTRLLLWLDPRRAKATLEREGEGN